MNNPKAYIQAYIQGKRDCAEIRIVSSDKVRFTMKDAGSVYLQLATEIGPGYEFRGYGEFMVMFASALAKIKSFKLSLDGQEVGE